VHLTPLLEPRPLRGYIDALNLGDALRIVVNE
jgi:hypothetical protein